MRVHFFNGAPHTPFRLFMSGFGVLPRAFSPTQPLAMVYDYRDFANLSEILTLAKDTKSLIAWSMGVAIASRIFTAPLACLDRAVAINGTIAGIDSRLGIHPRLFKRTIAGFDREAFARGCFGQRAEGEECEEYGACEEGARLDEILSPAQNLTEELQSLQDFCSRTPLGYVPKWREAFVSEADGIFSPLAQNLAWEAYAKAHEDFRIHKLACAHFVFSSLEVL